MEEGEGEAGASVQPLAQQQQQQQHAWDDADVNYSLINNLLGRLHFEKVHRFGPPSPPRRKGEEGGGGGGGGGRGGGGGEGGNGEGSPQPSQQLFGLSFGGGVPLLQQEGGRGGEEDGMGSEANTLRPGSLAWHHQSLQQQQQQQQQPRSRSLDGEGLS